MCKKYINGACKKENCFEAHHEDELRNTDDHINSETEEEARKAMPKVRNRSNGKRKKKKIWDEFQAGS